MKIVWDERKRLANLAKHGIDFADIDEEFFARAVVGAAKQGRSFAIGRIDGVILVIFVRLGHEGVSIVSRGRRAERNGGYSNDAPRLYAG